MKNQSNNIQIRVENAQHVQLGGQAFYGTCVQEHVAGDGALAGGESRHFFMFTPDEVEVGTVVKFRGLGIAQQLADGTFDFVSRPKQRPKSTLIKKLAHGRLSATIDGGIQLTLKVYKAEGLDIRGTLIREAMEAFE